MQASHRFDRFEVLPDQRQLLVDGRPAALGARAFDLLLALLAHRDRVVGKDELMALVWPGMVVEENNLTVQVSALRKVLGAGAVATVAGRGYRFTLQESLVPLAAAPATTAIPALHNLPAERSSFIGRQQEIAAVRATLADHRLVTLTGIGGSGKTRLALQVGMQELAHFADGVFFVDLAPVADPDLVPLTLAGACGLSPGDSPAGTSRTLTDRLITALSQRHCLLIVDNCEHLLDATAELVDRLLAGCSRLALLATSREALDVEGEQVVQVPSLALPDEAAPGSMSDAVRLFADRAHAVQSSFVLDDQTWPAVAEICRRLDGIPLAIEFAAARVAHLAPAQLAERLVDRFRLLTGGRRRIARQQTLAAALDWSHDLLDATEQRVFRRLAVFAGGFPLAAAEAVCSDAADGGPGRIAPAEVLDLLGSLAAKSLLTVGHDDAGGTRYRLLETVRLYALDKLAAAGETQALRARHRDHHLAWLDSVPMEDLYFGAGGIEAIGREIDNLRAATDWSVAEDRPDLVARLVTRMAGYFFTGRTYRAAGQWLSDALRQEARLSAAERVDAHAVLAWLDIMALDLARASHHAARSVETAAGRPSGFAAAAMALQAFCGAVAASMPGADPALIATARVQAAAAVDLASADMPPAWRAQAELFFGHVEMHVQSYEAAAHWYGACLGHCGQLPPDVWLLPVALCGQAAALHLQGRAQAAAAAARRVLQLPGMRDVHLPLIVGWRIEVTPALVAGGDEALALPILREGALTLRRNGVDLAPNHYLSMAAVVAFLRGQPERAALLLGAARSVGGADQQPMAFRTPASLSYYTHYLPLVREALGPEAARRARDQGRAMSLDQAFDYALEALA